MMFYESSLKHCEFSLSLSLRLYHCVKSVRIRSYSGSHFSRIRTEYGNILEYGLFLRRVPLRFQI